MATKTKVVFPPKNLSSAKMAAAAQNLKQLLAAHGYAAKIVPNYGVVVPSSLNVNALMSGTPVVAAVQGKISVIEAHPVYPSLGGYDAGYQGDNPSLQYAPAEIRARMTTPIDGFDGVLIGNGAWRRVPRSVSRWLVPADYMRGHEGGSFIVGIGDNAIATVEVWDYSTKPPRLAKMPMSFGEKTPRDARATDIRFSGQVEVQIPATVTNDMGVALFLTQYHGSETIDVRGI